MTTLVAIGMHLLIAGKRKILNCSCLFNFYIYVKNTIKNYKICQKIVALITAFIFVKISFATSFTAFPALPWSV